MAYESFQVDSVQRFNDPGLYFVRENGRLRNPGQPCCYYMAGPARKNYIYDKTSGVNDKSFTTVPSVNYPTNTPRKLYDMTLDFVAVNITLVESLVSFPEIVGRQLFDATLRRGGLGREALGLFGEAYGHAVLERANLQGCKSALNRNIECVKRFAFLSELEVGSCDLGDDHELLTFIASSLHSLIRLGLSNNGLSDAGIRRLTAPLRVMRRGPHKLAVLDLAGNRAITDKSTSRYLPTFTTLRALDLSGCAISADGLQLLMTKLKLTTHSPATGALPTTTFLPPVKTLGWALPLVDHWRLSSVDCCTENKASSDSLTREASRAAHFYGKTKKQPSIAVKIGSVARPASPTFPTVQLISAASSHHEGSPSQVLEPNVVGRKRGGLGRTTEDQTDASPLDPDRELAMQYSLNANQTKPNVLRNAESVTVPLADRLNFEQMMPVNLGCDTVIVKASGENIDKQWPRKRIKLAVKPFTANLF